MTRVLAPLSYEYPLTSQIHALKFMRARSVGRALGLLLARHAREGAGAVDALIPVPLHRRRLLTRGYNQAVEIARPVAKELRRPLLLTGIMRPVSTRPQTELDLEERQSSVRDVFAVSRDVEGRRVAIIDDVITTGATVNSLADALLAAGAAEVHAWAVARTL